MPRTVAEVMTPQVHTLPPEATLEDAILFERKHKVRHIPIVENGRLVGIVTDRDIKRATPSLVGGIDQDNYELMTRTTPVSRIMTRDPITGAPSTTLREALELFSARRVGCLPVLDLDMVVGIVTSTDLLRAFGEHLRATES
jgi:acetoin utilization protein AcuB